MLDTPIDELQNDILYTCYSRTCKDVSNRNQLIFCVTCRRGFHSKCCDPPLKYDFVSYYEWQCNRCKLCAKCHVHEDDEIIVICDCCDRAYHLGCTLEKYDEVPSGRWYCDECSCCIVCTVRLDPKEVKRQRRAKNRLNIITCTNCTKIYFQEDGFKLEICDCCNFAIIDTIKCSFCNAIIHKECVNGNGVCKNCESLGNGYQDPNDV